LKAAVESGFQLPVPGPWPGNLFRYDSGRYIFSLNMKTLSAGTYQLLIDVGDGVLRTVNISLR
jgi:hypothetical protein